MKVKHIIIVSLILAILTIGAVSASDDLSDNQNLTANSEDIIEESSVDEIELTADDTDDVVGDDDKITDYDYSVEIDDEYLIGNNVYINGNLPSDASGTVSATLDGDDAGSYDVGGSYFNLYCGDSLEIGPHNCIVSYSGDDKYAGFTYQKSFNISHIAINMPDEVEIGYSNEGWVTLAGDCTGVISISFDNEEYKKGLIEDLLVHYDYDMYYIPIIIDSLSFGQHEYEINYTVDGDSIRKTGLFNVSYRLDCDFYDDEGVIPYGKDMNITVNAPNDAKSNITVDLNGNSFEYKLNGKETIIPLTNLLFGKNTLTLTYSDDNYPLKTVRYTFNVNGAFDIPYGPFDYTTDEVVSLTLPDGATGNVMIYKIITDEDTWEDTEVFLANVPLTNGYASYPIKNLGLGEHHLLLKYDNGNYDVEDADAFYDIYPVVTYDMAAVLNQEANFTLQFPEGADGNLIISIFECNEDGDRLDYEADPIELFNDQITSDNITISLDTSKKGFFKILFSYQDDDIDLNNEYSEFKFNVYDVDKNWQLNVDFPTEILQGDWISVDVNYPKGADGNLDFYVDGNREYSIGGVDSEDNAIDFSADFTIGVHKWAIKYYGDTYFTDSYQNGTFEISWVQVPAVIEIGANTNIEVNIKGGSGVVKLKINGDDYDEQTLVDNKATFNLEDLNQGTYTYEVIYGDVAKSGEFKVSYAINAKVAGVGEYESIKFMENNEIEVTVPEDAIGTVDIILNSHTYSGDVEDGVAHIFVPLAWGVNDLTIRFNGDDKYELKEVQKRFIVEEAEITGNIQDNKLVNASLYLPSDAQGNLTISRGYGENLKSIQLENGKATITTEGLPVGCYSVRIYYDGEDYVVRSYWDYVSIDPEMNITSEIEEGDDCIIEISLPDSTSAIDVYVDGEFNKTFYFVDGKVKITIPVLSLGNHIITFIYSGWDYNNPFEYYDYDEYTYAKIPYEVEVIEKTVELINPDFVIAIENVDEETPITVKVTAVDEFSGNVIVKIGENDVLVSIVSGEGTNNTSLILPVANDYVATIDFEENDKFNSAHAETTFNVTAKPIIQEANLSIQVQDIDLGNSVTIYITINENVTKNVTVNVLDCEPSSIYYNPNPYEHKYNNTLTVTITKGKGNVTLTDLPNRGKYSVSANYAGDELVANDEDTKTFRVLDDSSLNVEISESIYENEALKANISMKTRTENDVINININMDPAYSGDDVPILFPMMLAGQSNTTWTQSGLSPNTYRLTFAFEGNDYYKPATVTKTVTVKKFLLDPELEVQPIEDIYVGSEAKVIFTIHKNATGKVIITVNEKPYEVTLNGAGSYTKLIPDLEIGTHNMTVSYAGGKNSDQSSSTGSVIVSGDKRYDFGEASKNVTVKVKPIPVSANLTVTGAEIYIGENATIKVMINESVTGNVSININGEDKLINIVNGEGNYTIADLPVGVKTYDITFAGDEYFLSDTKQVTVNVKDYDARIEIINAENEFNNGNFTFKVINNTNNAPISGVNVTLRISGVTSYGNVFSGHGGVTDENGIVSFKTAGLSYFKIETGLYPAPLDVGKHLFTIEITNNSIVSQKIESNLTITPANVKITVNPYEEYYGSEEYLIINVANIKGEILPNAVFKLQVPDINSEAFYGLTDENGTIKVSVKQAWKGTHEIIISNNDTNVVDVTQKANFTIKPLDAEFNAAASDVYVGENATIEITANKNFQGFVTIKIKGQESSFSVKNGTLKINLENLKAGDFIYNITYTGDPRYSEGTQTVSFKVNRKSISFNIEIANVEEGNPITVKVTSDKAYNGDVIVRISESNVTVSMRNGEGTSAITLPVGNYTAKLNFTQNDEFKATYAETSFNVTAKSNNGSDNSTPSGNGTNTTVPASITANDLTAYYTADKYSVTVYVTDAKLAPKDTQVIFKINGKQVGTAKTNDKGVATIKLNQKPGTYKITAEALGANITKKLTVKHIIVLKKVKVKRSAKKLVIKVTVKVGKKAVAKKKVTLKFKNKKYTAKTNKKGVAKFTIKKNVLKKLKKGKKVTYQATYLKDTVKRTVKVK